MYLLRVHVWVYTHIREVGTDSRYAGVAGRWRRDAPRESKLRSLSARSSPAIASAACSTPTSLQDGGQSEEGANRQGIKVHCGLHPTRVFSSVSTLKKSPMTTTAMMTMTTMTVVVVCVI